MTVAFAAILAQRGMPDWAAVCGFILLPLSAIAAAVALGQFSHRGGWPKIVPIRCRSRCCTSALL